MNRVPLPPALRAAPRARPVVGYAGSPTDLGPGFWPALTAMTSRLGTDPRWMVAMMVNESNIDPAARNESTNASGLIQFIPETLRLMGYPGAPDSSAMARFRALSGTAQLPYVERYFADKAGKLNTPGRLYWKVYYPGTMWRGESPNAIVTSGSATASDWPGFAHASSLAANERGAYHANQGFDHGRKGYITLADMDATVRGQMSSPRYRWAITQMGLSGEPPSPAPIVASASGGASGFSAQAAFGALLLAGAVYGVLS